MLQGFAAEAMANGALEVMPGLSDPSDPASTLSFPDRAYYINDRFVETVPEELVESLVALYANATSPRSLILIESTDQLPEVANNATAFGYRSEWLVWVWPFWTRTNGGAAIDGNHQPSCSGFYECFCSTALVLVWCLVMQGGCVTVLPHLTPFMAPPLIPQRHCTIVACKMIVYLCVGSI